MAALEFQINLGGNLSSSLSAGNTKLGETERHLHGAVHGVALFEGKIGELSTSMGGLGVNLSALASGGPVFTFDLAEGLRAVYDIAEKVVEKVIDLGKEIVHIAAEKQDIDLSVNLVFGDNAEAVHRIGEQFQERSRFTASEIEKLLLPLGQAGIRDEALLGRLATAATDLAARGGTGLAGAQEAVEAFKKIQLRGEVNPRILEKVFGSEQKFYIDLGAQLGVSGERAREMMKDHKIDNDRLLSTVLYQISVAGGTPGILGTATEASAKTLGGLITRIGNVPEMVFERLAHSEGIVQLQGVLENFLTVMAGPVSQSFSDSISTIFSDLVRSVFGDLTGPDGVQKMREKISDFAADVKAAIPEIKQGFLDVIDVAKALGTAIEVVAKTIKLVVEGWRQIGQLFDSWAGRPWWQFVIDPTGILTAGGKLAKAAVQNVRGARAEEGIARVGSIAEAVETPAERKARLFGAADADRRLRLFDEARPVEALRAVAPTAAIAAAVPATPISPAAPAAPIAPAAPATPIAAATPAAPIAPAAPGAQTMGKLLYLPAPAPATAEEERLALAAEARGQTQPQAHMAEGGLITRPTIALVGEQGPEAVVPLDRVNNGAGARTVSIGDIHVDVHLAGGAAGHDPHAAGFEIAKVIRVEIKKLLDEVSYGSGSATSVL